MKRIIVLLFSIILSFIVFTSCASSSKTEENDLYKVYGFGIAVGDGSSQLSNYSLGLYDLQTSWRNYDEFDLQNKSIEILGVKYDLEYDMSQTFSPNYLLDMYMYRDRELDITVRVHYIHKTDVIVLVRIDGDDLYLAKSDGLKIEGDYIDFARKTITSYFKDIDDCVWQV